MIIEFLTLNRQNIRSLENLTFAILDRQVNIYEHLENLHLLRVIGKNVAYKSI